MGAFPLRPRRPRASNTFARMRQRVVTLAVPKSKSDQFGVVPDFEALAGKLAELLEGGDWHIVTVVALEAGYGARTIEPTVTGRLTVEGATAHGFSWTDSLLIVLQHNV